MEQAMKDADITSLHQALLSLKTEDEMRRFLTDLCTPNEIKTFVERWAIARLLEAGALNYRDIASQTGASTTTVTRVARFLKQEQHGGYKTVLARIARKI